MTWLKRSHDLIATARDLTVVERGRPRRTNLARAVSTLYYALFHGASQCCADRLVGTNAALKDEWRRCYRALEHKQLKNTCRVIWNDRSGDFAPSVQEFAKWLALMQHERHRADYDPNINLRLSEVREMADEIEDVIGIFETVSELEQRRFAAVILFADRQDKAPDLNPTSPLDDYVKLLKGFPKKVQVMLQSR